MLKTCDICDFYRCVILCEEMSRKNKNIAAQQRHDATVCVKPESPFYGEHRRKGSKVCPNFRDWFYRFDFGGDSQAVRKTQTELVDKYRTERLGLEALGLPGLAP